MNTTDESNPALELMRAARNAARDRREVPVEDRARRLGRLRTLIVQSRKDIVAQLCEETGKTSAEALISDVLPTLEILHHLEDHAAEFLRPHRRPTPLIYRPATSRVQYRPRGVVLVIAPWNNPFQLSLVPAASALAAGNAVILKPSERTPQTGRMVGDLCRRAGIENHALQVACGGGDLAEALVEAGPDMIFFTGGTRNGRAVLRAAAGQLIPVTLELGGKDPMIVFADANLTRAARAAAYGAFAHAGQHCVSIKRLYVHNEIYEQFLRQLTATIRDLPEDDLRAPVVDESAGKQATEQVREAIEAGARLLLPDDPSRAATRPTLLADASHAMRIMREETFAPVLAAQSFKSEQEALRLANDSSFGLNASLWSEDSALCERVVDRMETGNVFVNNVFTNVGNPHLPFGGVKDSGLGRYHGPEGLRSFCHTTSVMISRNQKDDEPNWFPHTKDRIENVKELIELRHGDRSILRKITGWLKLLWRMRESC